MATQTTNLGLTKPAYSDPADISVINTNMDTIDTAIKALQDSVSQLPQKGANINSAVFSQTSREGFVFGIRVKHSNGSDLVLLVGPSGLQLRDMVDNTTLWTITN